MENKFIYLSINDVYVFRRMIDRRLLKRETALRDLHVDDRFEFKFELFSPSGERNETTRRAISPDDDKRINSYYGDYKRRRGLIFHIARYTSAISFKIHLCRWILIPRFRLLDCISKFRFVSLMQNYGMFSQAQFLQWLSNRALEHL